MNATQGPLGKFKLSWFSDTLILERKLKCPFMLLCLVSLFLSLQIYISTLFQFCQHFVSVERHYTPKKKCNDDAFISSHSVEKKNREPNFFFFFLSLRSKSCASLEIHIYDFSEILYDSNSRAEIKLKNLDYYSID